MRRRLAHQMDTRAKFGEETVGWPMGLGPRPEGRESPTAVEPELTAARPSRSICLRALRAFLAVGLLGFCIASAVASAADPVHFYNNHWTRFPEGEDIMINSYGYIEFQPVSGTTKKVACNKVDADGYLMNPIGGGSAIQIFTTFDTSGCTQSGYCAAGETPTIGLNGLPLGAEAFAKPNGYRFEHWNVGFLVKCNGKNVVGIGGGWEEEIFPYLSNGRYEVGSPPSLYFDDGGHYETQYGNTGNLTIRGSGGTQVIQPRAYLSYLGYDNFLNDVIPSNAP